MPKRLVWRGGVGLLLFLTAGRCAVAGDVDYTKDVKPLLKRCYSCHSALRQKSGLRLDAAVLIRKGGDSGPAIVPGKAAGSLLIDAVKGTENEVSAMPPKGTAPRLKPNEIAVLAQWINAGAVAPKTESIPEDPHKHWAFRKPVRPKLPRVVAASSGTSLLKKGRGRNPIDLFITTRYAEHGLTPRPPAAKNVLLRRLYLDLIGLPPTRAELKAFLADGSETAYEKVVDRLLESPRYGERWGRHWMDVWRYADWAGYKNEIRESQRYIWHWRDWIVESLNADKPYDRMVREMLAADEIAPADSDALRATGFLGRNWYKFNRNVWLQSTVEHTGKAFLGLTLNCGVCHEHKYDPISNTGFYRFRAFFEPHDVRTDQLPDQPNLKRDGLPRVYDKNLTAVTYRFEHGNEKHPDKAHPLTPDIPTFFGTVGPIKPVTLPVESFYPALKPFVRDAMLSAARKRLRTAKAAAGKASSKTAVVQLAVARAELASLTARIAAEQAKYGQSSATDRHKLAVVAGRAARKADLAKSELAVLQAEQQLAAIQTGQKKSRKPARSKAAAQAKKGKPGGLKKAQQKLAAAKKKLASARKAVQKTSDRYQPLGPVYPRTSSGRRTALARWITSRDNPLAARVAVNHIWMRHFGRPLVSSVFDFGMHGSKPTHPKLLDWLAVEFMENGWRMKALHRLIVTSAVYRLQSSTGGAETTNMRHDRDNRYLWRFNVHRVEAEAVRDSILYLAGDLNLTMGGPDIDPKQGQTSHRRSLYFRQAKEKQMVFVKLFDGPGTTECYQRNESIVPQQALAMVNSTVAKREARLLAGRLSTKSASGTSSRADEAFLTAAFEQILSRKPAPTERALCIRFLKTQTDLLRHRDRLTPATSGSKSSLAPATDPHQRARENLVLVLFNHNDFVTIR